MEHNRTRRVLFEASPVSKGGVAESRQKEAPPSRVIADKSSRRRTCCMSSPDGQSKRTRWSHAGRLEADLVDEISIKRPPLRGSPRRPADGASGGASREDHLPSACDTRGRLRTRTAAARPIHAGQTWRRASQEQQGSVELGVAVASSPPRWVCRRRLPACSCLSSLSRVRTPGSRVYACRTLSARGDRFGGARRSGGRTASGRRPTGDRQCKGLRHGAAIHVPHR